MAKVFKAYKEESRTNWGATVESETNINRDQIQLGAILRIADSLERMEQPFIKILEERDYYSRKHQENKAEIRKLKKSNAALKGVINKLKKTTVEKTS
jgi:hypothetical protein